MAERVGFEVALRSLRDALPLGGQPPRAVAALRSPHERGTPLSESPFESHLSLSGTTTCRCPCFFRAYLHTMAERVGFEPTVQLPGQRFSRPPDSATLAPLPTELAERLLLIKRSRYSIPPVIFYSCLWRCNQSRANPPQLAIPCYSEKYREIASCWAFIRTLIPRKASSLGASLAPREVRAFQRTGN